MRRTAFLPALVFLLAFVSEAGAGPADSFMDPGDQLKTGHRYEILMGRWRFGFYDWAAFGSDKHTAMTLGPIGNYDVPFTATQGLVGLCLIVVGLIALLTMLTMRWRRKAT
jgi:hypothetical protein